ncbi:sigma-70 family RNA polymerase sigma factor [Rhodobacteraceae bacterium 2376]|uniref:Sigma-70 family RNA polymerase sigma factor n=1 Tax=Rhabdonatronobacter sediminivivens TaxID=2743469 RepID=A0A7Z0KXG6_9RHOB|nr:sigma-70 family RNA polymerase sigma factor [Rhabdonatronobacter sediminivivens]NYS24395.1 sigma-70 family RNA polymerase sigma factor [Rhabdonatronobacter sediminivivens]
MTLKSELHSHVGSLRRYALVLTRDPVAADDLVQETLVKAIAKADTFQPGTDLRPWLFRILHNTHVSDLRRARTRNDAAADLPEPLARECQHTQLELKQVLGALDQLPEAQRLPIILIALREMSYTEAARTLDVPLGTFMSRLARGRAALRGIVQGMGSGKLSLLKRKGEES